MEGGLRGDKIDKYFIRERGEKGEENGETRLLISTVVVVFIMAGRKEVMGGRGCFLRASEQACFLAQIPTFSKLGKDDDQNVSRMKKLFHVVSIC